jgi:hypothetical protein
MRAFQPHHFQADLIWCDGTFKVYDWAMYGGRPDFIGDCTATQEELFEGEVVRLGRYLKACN